jgi:alkanesulfonate monooxygenase SsuD/methylene tetrahydromethanopterin reductase-like flavin-dependent oxidoreductase (luciferase family)
VCVGAERARPRPQVVAFTQSKQGERGRVQYEFNPADQAFADAWIANIIQGTPERVREGLDELVARTGADELAITTNVHSPVVKVRSYELIADAYGFPNATMSDGNSPEQRGTTVVKI